MKQLKGIFFIGVLLFIIGCVQVSDNPLNEVNLSINDPVFRKINEYQDKQEIDSLLLYTSHPDPSYRFLVGQALASCQSEEGLDSLYKLLKDPVIEVRQSAAYAIGQIRQGNSSNALVSAFKSRDTIDIDNSFNATILEAIGKLGNEKMLQQLATVTTYRSSDTLLLEGQCRAIYQFALRGIIDVAATDLMVKYVTDMSIPISAKMIAANYLFRNKDLDLEGSKFQIIDAFEEAQDPNVKMVLAIVVGRFKIPEALEALKRQMDEADDYRIRVNILRAISSFPYIQVVDYLLNYLEDKNLHIAITASEYLINHGIANDAIIYRDFLKDDMPYKVKANIYASMVKHIPAYYTNTRYRLREEIKAIVMASSNRYEQAAYIEALSYDPMAYPLVFDLMEEAKDPMIKSSGAMAISRILQSDQFIKTFRGNYRRIQREILIKIKDQISIGDVGINTIYGELLSSQKIDWSNLIDSLNFIDAAILKSDLPKEIEAYNSLKKARASLSNETYQPGKIEYNHPIDWSILQMYGDTIQAAVKTNKGVFRIDLFEYSAPGSVANFIKLADQDFYDGKTFHRVVSNFVVQGGCPRGDGFGALDYSIRSELSQLYYEDEGFVGMASAGPHTEGTQFFITHAPAMHLNGKYTIFGKVVAGMDVVHQLTVGDVIEDVIFTK